MSEKRLEKIQQEIQEELLRELEQGVSFSDEQMQDEIEIRVLKRGQMEYLTIEEKMELVKKIFNSVRRLDVLQELLEDQDITEIMINGPVMTIRRFPENPFDMDKLLELGSITKEAAVFLRTLVEARYNIFISGGTGSGKTTFLNALSNYIPSTERIVTIEDSAELQIQNIANLVRLETRNANLEGKNEITVRDLVRSALRQRPDRIIIGEIRDAAVIELLSAMNTGHDGSISTGHANSPVDMLRRLETLVLTGMDIPLQAVRSQIASAIEIVVQLGRLRDKSRKVLEIDEVCGIEDGEIVLRPLYKFQETKGSSKEHVKGHLVATDHRLANRDKLIMAGKETADE